MAPADEALASPVTFGPMREITGTGSRYYRPEAAR